MPAMVDVLVIGGGINGAGIAADAATRGLRVMLAEAGDLAGATSSSSSKLIHGGLRYLEQWAFRLVREALAEREVLLSKAPHIIWPMRFVLPHVDGMRSKLTLRAGLFLYDHLAARPSLPESRGIDLATDPAGKALSPELTDGFSYWDCWVDDARLVVLNAMAARMAGATVLTRTPVTAMRVEASVWRVTLGTGASERHVTAKAVVNSGGPWVGRIAGLTLGARNAPPPAIRMVKGSHIVVPRIAGADDALILQHPDGRVIFALPFEQAFTLIGTTDESYSGDPRDATISPAEIDYLLAIANRFLRTSLTRRDIVWQFSGVRPLDDDGSERASAVSRDYRLECDMAGGAPVVHVIGGKITTYRRLAEQAVDLLKPTFPAMPPCATATAVLPGGDVGGNGHPAENFAAWFEAFSARHTGFDRISLHRLARRYGTRADMILDGARAPADLGTDFGAGLSTREVEYLKAHEWAMTAEDVLWRRTKTALHLSITERGRAADAIDAALPGL
ncbi:MAG: glycerol-3-phosphate dehydrogenase [Hyphomicrobium sp.]|nr:glycerol-3-phosphate dehydrogenase [Hyphomicrobium sp.]